MGAVNVRIDTRKREKVILYKILKTTNGRLRMKPEQVIKHEQAWKISNLCQHHPQYYPSHYKNQNTGILKPKDMFSARIHFRRSER